MKKDQKYLLAMMLLPWLSLIFLGKESIKRFWLSSLIISILVCIESVFAHKKKWWWFYRSIHPKIPGNAPLILGPFFVGSFWILKFTYGNFLKYMKLNFIINAFFNYVLVKWFKKIGYCSFVRMKEHQMLLIFTVKAAVMYLIQSIIEKKKDNDCELEDTR